MTLENTSRLQSLLVLALSFYATSCSKSEAAVPAPAADAATSTRLQIVTFDPKSLERLGVKVEHAGTAGVAQVLQLPGTVEYDLEHYAEVGALAEGRIVTVNALVGDRVHRGQTLATMLVPSIASAQADFLRAQASLTVADEHAKRQDALLAEKLATGRDVELAHGEKLEGEAELAAAAARLKLLGVPLPKSGATIVPNGSMPLASPIDGVVVAREAVLGSYLEPNDTAFVVADPSTLWVTVQIFEADIPYFRIGTPVTLTVDALPGTSFTGKITLLEPEVGKLTRALRGRVEVPNADGALRPGLFVRASVPLPSAADTGRLLVPSAAVQPLGDRDVVFVERSPGKFEVREVDVARRTAQVSEISSGLAIGEPIVVEGAFVLRGEATKQ